MISARGDIAGALLFQGFRGENELFVVLQELLLLLEGPEKQDT